MTTWTCSSFATVAASKPASVQRAMASLTIGWRSAWVSAGVSGGSRHWASGRQQRLAGPFQSPAIGIQPAFAGP